MTQMWSFTLPNGDMISTTLEWKYVPYIDELRVWVLANWIVGNPSNIIEDLSDVWTDFPTLQDFEQEINHINKENLCRLYTYADELVEQGTKPKHPIGWVLDKVKDHMNEDI